MVVLLLLVVVDGGGVVVGCCCCVLLSLLLMRLCCYCCCWDLSASKVGALSSLTHTRQILMSLLIVVVDVVSISVSALRGQSG